MLNQDVSCFEKSVDIQVSWILRIQLIRIYTVFHSACEYMLITEIWQVDWMKFGRSVVHSNIQHDKGKSPKYKDTLPLTIIIFKPEQAHLTTVKTLYNVTRYNRIFNIRHKIAGNRSVAIKIPSL